MAVINKIKKGADEYDIQDPNAATKTELQALETTVSGKQNALTETQLAAVNSGIDSTKVGQIATNASDIDTIEAKIPTEATAQNQLADKSYVDTADNGLQSQIDAISASSDVKDIVGTKAELNNYDTSTLGDNDIIKVLQDESENDATTYYRWSTSTNTFTLIGEEGPYYTKSQANALLDDKVDKVAGKGLSENDFTTTLKDKLDGIEAGAEVNEIDSISINGTPVTPDANKNVDLTIPDGIITLTTADYNWHKTGDTDNAVALWLLSNGFYSSGSVDCYVNTEGSPLPANSPIIIYGVANERRSITVRTGTGGVLETFIVSNIGGNQSMGDWLPNNNNSILTTGTVVNSLSSASAIRPLSANQGRALKGLVDNKADKTAFTGTDGTSAGTMGLVPAPATTDAGKVLSSDGSWTTVDGIKTLTMEDYNWPTTGTKTGIAPWLLSSGIYVIGESLSYYLNRNAAQTFASGTSILILKSETGGVFQLGWRTNGTLLMSAEQNTLSNDGTSENKGIITQSDIINRLDRTSTNLPLSANQGRVLNDKIEGRLKTNAGAPTTSTTGTKGQLLEDTTNGNLYICTDATNPYVWKQVDKDEILTNAGAPTTSTAGTLGQLLTDTTNAKLYQLTAIDTTDPQNPSYTWTEVGGSSVNVVQTTGTSTTDVMSQNAVTGMIYADPGRNTKIRIGSSANPGDSGIEFGLNTNAGYHGIAIGRSAVASSGNSSLALGDAATATNRVGAVAIGAFSSASADGEMNIGSTNTAYGYNSSNYRLLSGLYDPQSAHDAATKGYVDNAVINGGTTQPTTSTVGAVGTQYNCVNSGTPEIYICTDTTGGTYTWTKIN